MKTPRLVKGYLIAEFAVILVFGWLLTPAHGANVFLLGPRFGLIAAFLALPVNPVVGIIGLFISGQQLVRKNGTMLVLCLLILSLGFTLLFPVVYLERGISHIFGSLIAR